MNEDTMEFWDIVRHKTSYSTVIPKLACMDLSGVGNCPQCQDLLSLHYLSHEKIFNRLRMLTDG